MKIHQSELDELPPQNDEDPMVPKTIVFPAYELTPSTVGFGNGSTRIETRAIELRCDPKYAAIMKKLITRTSNGSNNDIQFQPMGMVQVIGPDMYRRLLEDQNKYLHQ